MFLHEWALEMRPVCVTWQASSRHLTAAEKRQREKVALIALSLGRKIGAALYIRKKKFMKIQVVANLARIIKARESGVFYSAVGRKQNNNRKTRSKLSVLLHGS